jgi:Zn-dependent oligopeptidase
LLDPSIGSKYITDVIGRGASDDPNNLLKNFLGRQPSDDAFFKDMGL